MKEDNAYYCRQAIDLKLVRNSTEFWTKVKASGLTAREWVRIANSKMEEGQEYDNLDQPGWSRGSPARHNYGTVRITTAHISHRPTTDEIRLDVTIKSGLKMFAPSWAMVIGYKKGWLHHTTYAAQYHEMMEKSYEANKADWEKILHHAATTGKLIVLCCYCRKGEFCHRHLLAKILAEKAEGLSYHGLILPEK